MNSKCHRMTEEMQIGISVFAILPWSTSQWEGDLLPIKLIYGKCLNSKTFFISIKEDFRFPFKVKYVEMSIIVIDNMV